MTSELPSTSPSDPIATKRRHRGVYLIPSLITSMALFLGFYAIIFTLQGARTGEVDFRPAVFALILAGVFDNMDGRIARLMKVESAFGVQYDSIADMVSFGIAPAIIAYGFALYDLQRLGWLGAFLFLACAGLRLARFNVMTQEPHSRKYFKGMPSPVAASGLGLTMLMLSQWFEGKAYAYAVFSAAVSLAILMVSNVRFRTFKDLDMRRHPLQKFLLIMLVLVTLFVFHEEAAFCLFALYLLWGLGEEIVLFRRRRKSDPSVPFLPFGDRNL